VVHGSSVPARSLACRPRRIRSAISVRSLCRPRHYADPAERCQQGRPWRADRVGI